MDVLSLLAGFRAPVPLAALAGVDVGAAMAAGRIVLEGGRVRPHPLADLPSPAGPDALLDALLGVERTGEALDESLLGEALRLALIAERPERETLSTRLVQQVVIGGTAPEMADSLIASGAMSAWLTSCRSDALRMWMEAGRMADAAPLLSDADAPLEARHLIRQGAPRAAVARLEGVDGVEAAIVRARAWLNLGRPRVAHEIARDLRLPADPLLAAELDDLTWLAALELAEHEVLPPDPPAGADPLATADRRLLQARAALRFGDLGRATTLLADVRAALGDRRAPRLRAQSEFVDALVAFYAGNHDRLAAQLRRLEDQEGLANRTVWHHARAVEAIARSAWDEARRGLEVLGASNDYGLRTMLAWIALQTGDLDRADALLADADSDSLLFRDEVSWLRRLIAHRKGEPVPDGPRASPCRTIRAVELLLEAELALDRGDGVAAAAAIAASRRVVEDGGIGVRRADLWLAEADLEARAGRVDEALRCLDLAEAHLTHPEAPQARLVMAARVRLTGRPLGDGVRRAWERLPDPTALAVARGDSVRFGPPSTGPRLEVAADGRWFRVDDHAPVDLARRRVLRRLLAALGRARVDHAGPLGLEALVAAGWPEERVLPDAAANRVHVALHHLRSLGLGEWIAHDAEGWTLRGGGRVVLVEGAGHGDPA